MLCEDAVPNVENICSFYTPLFLIHTLLFLIHTLFWPLGAHSRQQLNIMPTLSYPFLFYLTEA